KRDAVTMIGDRPSVAIKVTPFRHLGHRLARLKKDILVIDWDADGCRVHDQAETRPRLVTDRRPAVRQLWVPDHGVTGIDDKPAARQLELRAARRDAGLILIPDRIVERRNVIQRSVVANTHFRAVEFTDRMAALDHLEAAVIVTGRFEVNGIPKIQ